MPDKYGYEPDEEDIEAQLTADLAAQDCGLPPNRCTPEQGIAAMQKRIAYLRKQVAVLEADDKGQSEVAEKYILEHQRQIAAANLHLREYQTQLEGRN